MTPLQLDWKPTHRLYLNFQSGSSFEGMWCNRNTMLPATYLGTATQGWSADSRRRMWLMKGHDAHSKFRMPSGKEGTKRIEWLDLFLFLPKHLISSTNITRFLFSPWRHQFSSTVWKEAQFPLLQPHCAGGTSLPKHSLLPCRHLLPFKRITKTTTSNKPRFFPQVSISQKVLDLNLPKRSPSHKLSVLLSWRQTAERWSLHFALKNKSCSAETNSDEQDRPPSEIVQLLIIRWLAERRHKKNISSLCFATALLSQWWEFLSNALLESFFAVLFTLLSINFTHLPCYVQPSRWDTAFKCNIKNPRTALLVSVFPLTCLLPNYEKKTHGSF